jgi:hypothetical protein
MIANHAIRFAEDDGDRSPMTKAVTGDRTPNKAIKTDV